MFRIDDPSAVSALPAPEAAGTPGYYTEGIPGTTPATIVRASHLNMMQEELLAPVLAAGLTPSKTVRNQLLQALQAMYGPGRPGHVYAANDWAPIGSGLILQWGAAVTTGSGVFVTYPIAFPNAARSVIASVNGVAAAFYLLNVSATGGVVFQAHANSAFTSG
ncbi:MAG: gp53-like domain-containing protein, partial [Janthinobacterium lividum]